MPIGLGRERLCDAIGPPAAPDPPMSLRLPGASTLVLLTLPPLVWASNAVFGRIAVAGRDGPLASPLTLNALRWALALLILFIAMRPWSKPLPRMAPGTWRIMAVLGLMSVTLYNSMQYVALQTSSAINVTLIAASGPFWMLLVGRVAFGEPGARWAWIGAAVSLGGVLVVMTGGDLARLIELAFVPGDAWMITATLCWAVYSWLLRRYRPSLSGWNFILIQIAWGSLLSAPLVAGEWASGALLLRLDAMTFAVVLWMALGPSLLAYWCWDRGVARAGPILPMFFLNLTPLFAAMMSAAIVGEPPRAFHAVAFALIVTGIVLSQRRP
jgi:drug/metabolite transporter (DMT)-like permease